jgi:hypothetical protein
MPEEEKIDDSEFSDDVDSEDDNLDEEFPEEEEEELDLFQTEKLDKIIQNPESFLDTEEKKNSFNISKEIKKEFAPNEETDNKVHPGFVSSFSFGEKEFELLSAILTRLHELVERVFTYRKDDMQYFPELYSTLKNFYTTIKFLIDTTNRKKIATGFTYVKSAVIDFTQNKNLDLQAVQILEEIYELLMNIKNFHNLGISYEKKKGDSEKYYGRLFGNKTGK